MIKEHIELLGYKYTDKVTGFKGVASSIAFDLYGCVQIVLTPTSSPEGKIENCRYFDVTRLTKKSKKRVMEIPDFVRGYVAEGKKGAAEKPLP